jgi:thiamine-monophosphate kinase
MRERDVIAQLRELARHPAALGLNDDVALFEGLILTHDSIAEGVHFLAEDPPASVGWKLVAVNLSDVAAKGARPEIALLSLTLGGPGSWTSDFLSGVEAACESYGLTVVGGDTIALPAEAPRVLGLTVLARAAAKTPLRSGGKAGDQLWLVGTVGDSAAGLAQLRADPKADGPLVEVYRRPVPQLAAGAALALHAHAMMDVSDGLLLDAARMAEASGLGAIIELDALPLSASFVRARGLTQEARLFAATGGDDYALLAALPEQLDPSTLSLPSGTTIRRIGRLHASGPAVSVFDGGEPVPLPETLGHEHHSIAAPAVGDRR